MLLDAYRRAEITTPRILIKWVVAGNYSRIIDFINFYFIYTFLFLLIITWFFYSLLLLLII